MKSYLELQFKQLTPLLEDFVGQPEVEYRFDPERRFRFDFAWPQHKLAVEIQGGTWIRGGHSTGTGIARDHEKNNLAVTQGWRVLYFTKDALNNVKSVVETIELAVKAGQ